MLVEVWERGWWRAGNDAGGGVGTRLVEAWERCWWRCGNEAGGGLGTRLVETGLASLPGDLPMSKQVQQASIFCCMPSLRASYTYVPG